MRFDALVVSCEHASNRVPAAYRRLFRGAASVLTTHRGCDIGAAPVARALARRTNTNAHCGTATRLLVDVNRSLHHRAAFSEWSRSLPTAAKAEVVATYYASYRAQVTAAIDAHLAEGRRVLHVSVHSFTPVLHRVTRVADVGLLYDPSRASERALCAEWKDALAERATDLRVRRNYPYRGTDDGFVPTLRQKRSARRYAGVEIEMNQAIVAHRPGQRRMAALLTALVAGVTHGLVRG